MASPGIGKWTRILGVNRESVLLALRAALGTVLAYVLAEDLRLPEFYWAPISSIVILLSTSDSLKLAWRRFVGTAVGAALGALIAMYFSPNWWVYGLGIFVCGILSAVLRLASAYRFAAITLTIVLLTVHSRPPWVVAMHRFIEVSLGITVALAVTVVWRIPAESE